MIRGYLGPISTSLAPSSAFRVGSSNKLTEYGGLNNQHKMSFCDTLKESGPKRETEDDDDKDEESQSFI